MSKPAPKPVDVTPSLYDRMVAAGVEIGHHETDLYVPVNDETRKIIAAFEAEGGISNKSVFTAQKDAPGTPGRWFDLPFHYTPGWERRGAG